MRCCRLSWTTAVTASTAVRFAPVSSFPQIRRDISFTIAASETFGRIAERVSVAASTRLHELRIFDVYQGKGVESGRKSVALGLILQDISRTLTDADADEVSPRCARNCARVGCKIRIRMALTKAKWPKRCSISSVQQARSARLVDLF
jgi:phenylalanyl-tRNA synthetase beta chain